MGDQTTVKNPIDDPEAGIEMGQAREVAKASFAKYVGGCAAGSLA